MKHMALDNLIDEFDAFLLDQFGVLLDGAQSYPGAIIALSEIARRGKKVGILTNSGKRAEPNAARLQRLGFDRNHIDAVISSGEAARIKLRSMLGHQLPEEAQVLVLARDGDLSSIEGLSLQATDNANAADLVLIAGSRSEEVSLQGYGTLLEGPAARGVPALCTNPDMVMLTGEGSYFGAGKIAQLYRHLGGHVEEIGKPHKLIYDVAFDQLGIKDPASVLCIGDSPAHDIRGAHVAGCKAALVRTGIHADAPLETLFAAAPHSDIPDYIIPAFSL